MKKRMALVVVLALVLTFAFTASAFATTGKFFKGGVDYYTWLNPTGSAAPGSAWIASGVSTVGSNTLLPGVHSNYSATTAKCGICHSVHRAAGGGSKLLPVGDATCAGCHTGGTAVTAKIVTWGVYDPAWRVATSTTVTPFKYGGAGPHNDALDTMYADGEWDGISTPPSPSFRTEPFERYGCLTRRCHATNPHGANSSKYTIFAAKLLFNNTVEQDDEEWFAEHGTAKAGTYGGDDAIYDDLGATDASIQRFADANSSIITLSGSNILLNGTPVLTGPNARALVAGLTCGRPSNPGTGEDECHAEAAYAIVDKAIKEDRNHATKISGNDGSLPAYPTAANGGSNNFFRTDNTGGEALGFGGNDNRDSKTGHVAGSFAAVPTKGSYAPIAGCTSCHDQTDSANTVVGNFTFPHGQTPVGVTNATAANGTTGTMIRSRIWSGWSGGVGYGKTVTDSTTKAYDGQCLKCHRDGGVGPAQLGIGLTK